jgi:hypothetical protein
MFRNMYQLYIIQYIFVFLLNDILVCICWFVFPWFTFKHVFSHLILRGQFAFYKWALQLKKEIRVLYPSLKIILYAKFVFVVLFWSLRVPCWNHNCLKHFWSLRANCYRTPAEARFSPNFQTGPGAHPASYTVGTGSFPGAKQPGRSVNHPPQLAPRLNKEWSYTSILYPTPVPSCHVVKRTLPFYARSQNCEKRH